MCRKGHKTQKKCVIISKIRLKEVIFNSFAFKNQNIAQVVEMLRKRASVCLLLFETLIY